MKKIISILLVALTLFSFATVSFAADEATTQEKPVTVIFEIYDSEGNLKYVTVGVDYEEKIPVPETPSWVHPDDKTQKMFFAYWTTTHKGYPDVINNIEPIKANDGIKEITFTAWYEPRENNIQNNVQEGFGNIVDNLPGADAFEGMGDAFSTIIELIRKWVMQFVLYIRAFF